VPSSLFILINDSPQVIHRAEAIAQTCAILRQAQDDCLLPLPPAALLKDTANLLPCALQKNAIKQEVSTRHFNNFLITKTAFQF